MEKRTLLKGATVAVIGGGPAGSFFAISLQRQMRRLGMRFRVVILEKKNQLGFYQNSFAMAHREGCNYCAGGISPRMSDVLTDLELELPPNLIQSKIHSLTVHGHWKNIELKIPPKRRMLSVYRGARPVSRIDRFYGFDAYLLEQALVGGGELISGDAKNVQYTGSGRLRIDYQNQTGQHILEADLVVFACGVNQVPGMKLGQNELIRSLQHLIPGFRPPPVRRTLIFELEADPVILRNQSGEIYFIESGSRELDLEMCSIIPKEQFITVVLIGKSIDAAAGTADISRIIEQFLALAHIQKILPKKVELACMCRPNMAIGAARQPYGEQVAVIGDLVTSRLYKDGILSAYHTASALAQAVTEVGIDRASLKKAFEPAINRFIQDNHFGSLVFLLHRIMFSSPTLSRILYQALLTERKKRRYSQRKLENILWKIASGDDRYQEIFFSMISPKTLWLIFTGGGLITLRNYLAELLFGLDWRDISRFTTGIYREEFEVKSRKYKGILSEAGIAFVPGPEFEKMYSIAIKADCAKIFRELGRFGDPDQQFFKPRMIRVKRIKGEPLTKGSVLCYEVVFPFLNFTAVLERIEPDKLILYRVDSGFPKGGVLLFEIEKKNEQTSLLTIYVAFNLPRGRHGFSLGFWVLFKLLFPAFLHDVLWNHSLCKLKDIVERK